MASMWCGSDRLPDVIEDHGQYMKAMKAQPDDRLSGPLEVVMTVLVIVLWSAALLGFFAFAPEIRLFFVY